VNLATRGEIRRWGRPPQLRKKRALPSSMGPRKVSAHFKPLGNSQKTPLKGRETTSVNRRVKGLPRTGRLETIVGKVQHKCCALRRLTDRRPLGPTSKFAQRARMPFPREYTAPQRYVSARNSLGWPGPNVCRYEALMNDLVEPMGQGAIQGRE
jgi:hypothetical protein